MAFGMMYNDWSTLHALVVNTRDARIAAAHGEWTDAIKHWRAAVAVQDKTSYDEPADWYYPVRESLGAALLRGKHAAESEQVFRGDLERNRRNRIRCSDSGKATPTSFVSPISELCRLHHRICG
jgi:hypothetical protein